MQHSDDEQIDTFDCEYRYDLLLSQVVDKRELWILIDDNDCFLNIHAKEEGLHYLPVWPSEDNAQEYSSQSDQKLTPSVLSLPEFLTKWVAGLSKDKLMVGVFPIYQEDVWIDEAESIKSEIQTILADQIG